MSTSLPFSPSPGGTNKITANATPTSVSGALSNGAGSATSRLRVFNNGSVAVFVRLGTSAPTATNADLPLGAGQAIILEAGATTYAAVLSSTTTACDVYFTFGEGGS